MISPSMFAGRYIATHTILSDEGGNPEFKEGS